jgi:hypothetical protein
VGLKEVSVQRYKRTGPHVELMAHRDLGPGRPPHRGEELPANFQGGHVGGASSWRRLDRVRSRRRVGVWLAHGQRRGVTTYGKVLLAADRKWRNKTTAIGFEVRSFDRFQVLTT